jgi:hypothetical protein
LLIDKGTVTRIVFNDDLTDVILLGDLAVTIRYHALTPFEKVNDFFIVLFIR